MDNDWQLGSQLQAMVAELEELGSWPDAVEVALIHGRLAVRRGRRHAARRAARTAERLAADLRQPGTVAADLTGLAHDAEGLSPSGVLPATSQELLARMEEDQDPDPEADSELLLAAHEAWPDDRAVTTRLAMAVAAAGDEREAIALLDALVEGGAEDDAAVVTLVELRLSENDPAEVAALADRLRPESGALAGWMLARHAFAQGDWQSTIAHCKEIIAAEPDAANTRRLLSEAATRLGDFDLALQALLELRELGLAEEPDEWGVIVAATALQKWGAVRSACARLGIELASDGEGPIDEEWHVVVVRYGDGDALALRTGPATARILSVSLSNEPQLHGNLVVVEPTPAEPFDPESEEYPVFQHVTDLEAGSFVGYRIEGIAPDEEELDNLRTTMSSGGLQVWVYAAGDYDVELEDGTQVPGFFAMVAVPRGQEQDAHRRLAKLAGGLRHRVAWPELAAAAGDEGTSSQHRDFLDSLE